MSDPKPITPFQMKIMKILMGPFSRWNANRYMKSGGTSMGTFAGRDICVATMKGAKSGKVRHTPLMYLGHQPAVKGLLSPRENLAWHVAGESQYSGREIEAALASVGLYGYEDVPSHALSAGQHRRVNLARLYLSRCPLWLLDEPFTAIDKAGVVELEALLVRHVESGGAVVMTSHQALQVTYEVRFLSLVEGLVL